jgi:hypothetical protein
MSRRLNCDCSCLFIVIRHSLLQSAKDVLGPFLRGCTRLISHNETRGFMLSLVIILFRQSICRQLTSNSDLLQRTKQPLGIFHFRHVNAMPKNHPKNHPYDVP